MRVYLWTALQAKRCMQQYVSDAVAAQRLYSFGCCLHSASLQVPLWLLR
jgi:hypothetical protein